LEQRDYLGLDDEIPLGFRMVDTKFASGLRICLFNIVPPA
jgi:hypothetical protein